MPALFFSPNYYRKIDENFEVKIQKYNKYIWK